MNKTLAVFISLGVILLIAGLTVVGIFGGEAIRNIKWDDVLNGKAHDLSLADTRIEIGRASCRERVYAPV